MTWGAKEFAGAQMGAARLNHRLIKHTERFADKPTASIPGACPDGSETQGAYRFFDQANNAKRPLKWETVLAPHIERTAARMRQHRVVLCLQDTTELDFNGQSTEGLGPLSYEAQRAMYVPPPDAVAPHRDPLGITDARMWPPAPRAVDGTGAGVRESLRWSEA